MTSSDALGAGPLHARTMHWWARARLRRGDRVAAQALLIEARALTEELAMVGLVAQVDALARPSVSVWPAAAPSRR